MSRRSLLTKLRAVGMFARIANERAALRVLGMRRRAPPLLALPTDAKRLIAEFMSVSARGGASGPSRLFS